MGVSRSRVGIQRIHTNRKLLGYGLAGALALTALGPQALAAPGVATRDNGSAPSARQAQFARAAEEFKVPQSVLMAVSYRQTRWEDHDGRPSTSGAYNVMGLTRVLPGDVVRPGAQERLAHLDLSGDPAAMKRFDARRAPLATPSASVDTDDPRLHTLDEAARLIGKPVDAVRDDAGQSILAGAALLARYQRAATGTLPADPGAWYPAVARYSQAPDARGADAFAERVFDSVRTGERRVTEDGQSLALPADPGVKPAAPATTPSAQSAAPECPAGLNCDVKPADPNNYNVANRPEGGFAIRQIVLHDTEASYDSTIKTFQDPKSSASTHYVVKDDGSLVTQVVATKDEAYHAGNKSVNMHALGVEHVGFAMKQGSWYGEPLYDASARLVSYLADRFSIPLDREHILGHDEVPGPLDGYVAGQHWDPGPFWDWNHYMTLLGSRDCTGRGMPEAGQVVKVVPSFTPRTTTYYDPATKVRTTFDQPVNFTYLYAAPSTDAAPLADPYLGTQIATEGPNWANKLVAGGRYVVADRQGEWTAVWYGGQKAWFHNPGGRFTSRVPDSSAPVVLKAKGSDTVQVYGRSYPEDAAYAGTGVPVQGNNSAPLTKYAIPAGQAYVAAGGPVAGDYYYGGTTLGTLVKGAQSFYPIRYNHRIAWVRAADVQQISPAG
ncbi:N-acetylmuramoyl-L-alanine amidase A [Streptomyces hundungensis]|uniref:N-acetylmuramoyl-L-alanine amidase n=1 Tax=Streptomyces hundungensis TaxID=1077946 RepID=A0A387HRA2_9ACTN|nr:N-acetylmuramoyl-L-alanine amidase A [Streptomyces hundungensis]